MVESVRKIPYNSTFAISGASCPADSLEIKLSSVLRINICTEKPAHLKSVNRYAQLFDNPTRQLTNRK